ncbi:FAD dependent oxidoreductase [Fragilaria crotonensis]|nr:FAD dependent oxidoreductase [Fragilaria crotonensis]
MSPTSRVLVVGSSAIGLRTAVELLRKNVSVVLRSPVPPLHTSVCSQGAGGLWMPFHCDDPRVDKWAIETLDELYPMAMDATNPLVELIPCVELKQDHTGPSVEDFLSSDYHMGTGGTSGLPSWTKDQRLQFQHLTAEMLDWQNNHVFGLHIPSLNTLMMNGYKHAWFFQSPIVDSPAMLTCLLEELDNHNDTIDVDVDVETNRWYESLDDMVHDAKSLNCDTVINCTGMGARSLLQDEDLVGARGILLHFDRDTVPWRTTETPWDEVPKTKHAAIFASEGPWGTETEPAYMIPRGDRLVVGGTYGLGDSRTEIAVEEHRRLLQNANNFGIDVESSSCVVVDEWTGFRPSRPTTMCEIDKRITDVTLVHSYGHGGSGWTVNVGVAKDVAKLLGL